MNNEIPYPVGHCWEGLTPSQVNEGYKEYGKEKDCEPKKEFNLSEFIRKIETSDGIIHCVVYEKKVKEFIKRDRELVALYMHGDITWTELRERQDKLAGDDLK